MNDRLHRDFPLFPLGIVTLPTEYVPLHIFEERYKTMVERCLDHDAEFGILWMSDDELKQTGCAVRIDRVLERMDDGRLNILCQGTRVFRLVERQDDLPYPAGTVEFLEDRDEPVDEELAARTRASYMALVAQATERVLEPGEVEAMTAYEMAATVDFGLDAKQGLLDLRAENARLRLVDRLFRAATKRLDYVERAQARAKSNGKVRFG
ncbi:MAG TPA: LON peptidase substrate-binding domain-containing protein [Capillimicrobium sp.]|jgi:Lon protease-like protein|nr:LON peptidase substrate-binding domain-containing protein [Capillimicrobium sp.]